MILRIAFAAVLLVAPLTAAAADEVRFNFESGNAHGWRVVEGNLKMYACPKVDTRGLEGKGHLRTDYQAGKKADTFVGVIESPVFVLAGSPMTLLVGGGKSRTTYVALCTLNGREVLKAHGRNSLLMSRVTWDVSKFVGKKVFMRVYDANSGGWGHVTLDDVRIAGRLDDAATKKRLASRKPILNKRILQQSKAAVATNGADSLRAAIKDLMETFPDRYPKGKEYLQRLAELGGDTGEKFIALQREALVANPLVSGRPIVFVARAQYRSDHHNTATMFVTEEINTGSFRGGGALKKIDLKTGTVTTLVDSPKGMCRDPDVSFDGKRVVFSMRRHIGEDYKIFEVAGAGASGLKQLTFAKGAADFDPLYLSDGSIVFSSTREPKYAMCNRHIMGNMFRMDGDGANIHQIGKSTLHEGHGTLTPDGRILYDRWEYVDRNFGDAQGLWTVNPDGTNHAVYWGNNTNSPGAVLDARIIPGTEQAICIFSSCHDRPWGALAIIDRRLGLDGRDSTVRTWPAGAINQVGKGGWDSFKRFTPKYEDPYPLNDKYFLVSRSVGRGELMGIYLVDIFGNEVLLHSEGNGCYDPMPLGPRRRPMLSPTRRDFKNRTGTFYVHNVYIGTHMKGVKPGSVKYLRVVESPEKRFWTQPAWGGQGVHCPGMNWHSFENKRILGTVPVEADGSAYFTVPADKFVYFQLLDENGMMIQSMRSGTMVQSGETTGCVGCHEGRRTAPPPSRKVPLAFKRGANSMTGWYGKPRIFNYTAEVQPVFDKHCVKCHDFGKKGGAKLILAGDRTAFFNASYTELWRKKMIKAIGAGPYQIQQAYSWGSHQSKLVQVIRKGHNKVKLPKEDMDRIVTWIDINAVYYPSYASAYPKNATGRSPLDGKQMSRLSQLTGARFVGNHGGNRGPQVSFDRPEMSPCLAKFKNKNDPKYKEALAIIQAGKDMLKKRPRADMPGFQPCEVDRQREQKYLFRRQEEMRNRKAIREGLKAYERPDSIGKKDNKKNDKSAVSAR